MSAIEDARQFLEKIGYGSAPQLEHHGRSDSTQAEVRPTSSAPARSAPIGPQKIRLPMCCSKTGKHFIGLVEVGGKTLRLVGAELVSSNRGAGVSAATPFVGTFNYFDCAPGVICPACSTSMRKEDTAHAGWNCGCGEFQSWLHCGGLTSGWGYCACGEFRPINPVPADRFSVEGEYSVSARKVNVPAPQPASRGAPTQNVVVALPPSSASFRLTYRRD